MRISVAMATFNGARHLPVQLESLASQSLLPSELVVSDDGSTDHTIDIINQFARSAPFQVRLFQNERRLNYRANFMKAANACQHEIICFCDQDDIWYPDKIRRSVAALEAVPDALLAFCNADFIDEGGRKLGATTSSDLAQAIPANEMGPWALALGFTQTFRASLMRLSHFVADSIDPHLTKGEQELAHDQFVSIFAAALGPVAYVQEPSAGYRQHSASATEPWRKPKLAERLSKWRENRSSTYGRLGRSAAQLARSFSEIAVSRDLETIFTDTQRHNAGRAAQLWTRIAQIYGARENVYTSSEFTTRFRALQDMIALGAYKNEKWSLGRDKFLKDVLYAIAPFAIE